MSARSLIAVYVLLVVLAGGSWLLSNMGAGPLVALAIAAVKAVAIGAVFMELAHAHPVPRIIAIVALAFVALLSAGILADVSLRQ